MAIVRLEGLGKLKKNYLIGTRTRDLPACSIVPQPTTLPRALWGEKYYTQGRTSGMQEIMAGPVVPSVSLSLPVALLPLPQVTCRPFLYNLSISRDQRICHSPKQFLNHL
jgi:hypothetical protein